MPPAQRPGLGPRGASRAAAECLLCPRQASPGAHLRPLLLPLRVPGPPCLTTSGGVAPAVCHASHGAKRTQQEAAPFLPPALPGWSDGRSVGYRPCPEGFNRGPERSVPAIRGMWPRRAAAACVRGHKCRRAGDLAGLSGIPQASKGILEKNQCQNRPRGEFRSCLRSHIAAYTRWKIL